VRRRKVTLITSIALTVVLIAAVIVAVVGLSSGDDDTTPAAGRSSTPTTSVSPTPTPTTSTSTAAKASYPCTWNSAATSVKQRNVSKPATTTPPKTGKVAVAVKTNRGPMTFTLNRAEAPCTVASFVSLVKQKYYDKTPCHRLTTNGIFVLQCGDPSGAGNGGPGYGIPDEAKGNEQYPAGTIAMARGSDANSGGSQFFIVYKDSPNLMQQLGTKQYTVFGQVSSGLGVVNTVAKAGSDNKNGTGDGAPKLKIEIDSMKQNA